MLAVTIDNFPPTLHAKLQEVAKRNHCSVTEQILTVLEQYLTTPLSPASVTQSMMTIFPSPDRRWLTTVQPLQVGLDLTNEWLNQAKAEGRE